MLGANIPAVIRGLIAVAWYGIQTDLASGAFLVVALHFFPGLGAYADAKQHGFVGLSTLGWVAFMTMWVLQARFPRIPSMPRTTKSQAAAAIAPTAASAETPPATVENIAQDIAAAIIGKRLPPGTWPREEALGRVYSVSRTKIRAALLSLSKDKLIEIVPDKGAFVSQPTVQEAREVFSVRRLLESEAVRLFVAKARPRDYAALEQHIRFERATLRATSFIAAFFVALVIGAGASMPQASNAAEPGPVVSGNRIESPRDPAVMIRLPEEMRYVGSDRFTLSKPDLGDFDACLLYAFAEADTGRQLRKFYWVQFEHYLAHPALHYTYDSPRHQIIGGLDFYVDTEVSEGTGTPAPGSDTQHFYDLLARHGYARAPMMFVRFVHLPDATRRKELMIIVGERLPDGLHARSVQEGGDAFARWPAIERDFIARSAASLQISRSGRP